jgi:hypothetical protein
VDDRYAKAGACNQAGWNPPEAASTFLDVDLTFCGAFFDRQRYTVDDVVCCIDQMAASAQSEA